MIIKKLEENETGLAAPLFDRYRMFYNQPSDLIGAAQYISDRLRTGESVVFVAFHEDEGKTSPVGFAQLYPLYSSISMTKNWILNDLFVIPESRGKGVGKLLISAAVALGKAGNAKFLQLETVANNYGAQRLYEMTGFEKQAIDTKFFLYKISFDTAVVR